MGYALFQLGISAISFFPIIWFIRFFFQGITITKRKLL